MTPSAFGTSPKFKIMNLGEKMDMLPARMLNY